LEDEDRDRVVRRAVLNLPAKYREVLVLFYFHDMDVSAAARSLGVPVGTVKAGREILHSKLSQLLTGHCLEEAL
jgi:RNA polymerase sigma-70 factor (ECF subfamily)